MKLKIKMLKNLISVLCAINITMACGVSSVSAVNKREINNIMQRVDDCNNLIKDLNNRKIKIDQEKSNRIRSLDNKIKDNENFLIGIIGLIAEGENHEALYKSLTRTIEESKRQETQINADYEKAVQDIDNSLRRANRQKEKLGVDLKKLLDKQDVERRRRPQLTQIEEDSVNLWKEIASGSQYHPSGYSNLCWLMTTMNQMNYFNLVDQNPSKKPVQGAQNAVNYYLATGGQNVFSRNAMQSDILIGEYLKHNGIATCKVTDSMEVINGIGRDQTKSIVAELAVDQIKTHFDASNRPFNRMSPVSICGGSHWITIVDYFKDTDNVLVIDSANGHRRESKIEVKNINEVLKNRISYSARENAMVLDLIFTTNKKSVDSTGYSVSSLDGFMETDTVLHAIAQDF